MLLAKLRFVAVRTDAVEATPLPAERGFLDAFRVRVPAVVGCRRRLGSTYPDGTYPGITGMVLPNGAWYAFNAPDQRRSSLLRGWSGHRLEVRAPAWRRRWWRPGDPGGGPGHPREPWPADAFASVAQPVPVAVDAAATILGPSAVPYRQYQVEFEATAGQWVHAEVRRPRDTFDPPVLLGLDGHQFRGADYWRIPVTGRYRLMVPSEPTTQSTQVRIRTIRQVAPSAGRRDAPGRSPRPSRASGCSRR